MQISCDPVGILSDEFRDAMQTLENVLRSGCSVRRFELPLLLRVLPVITNIKKRDTSFEDMIDKT